MTPELSTSGGTSDGRFIAPYGIDVVELGPINETIHQVNELVAIEDLERLERIYFRIAELLLVELTSAAWLDSAANAKSFFQFATMTSAPSSDEPDDDPRRHAEPEEAPVRLRRTRPSP